MGTSVCKTEFKSKLEEIMLAQELVFDPTPGFGNFRKFLDHAIAHPAKMNTKLLEFLILNFTREGETILDPMCGSGSTGVVAALHGRNAVQVDIEQKFVDWAEKARKNVERTSTLTPKGWIKNICGDARRLTELLKEADVVITSPPYSDIEKRDRSKESWWDEERERRKAGGSVAIAKGYQAKKGNIGNLPLGNVDAVITSPPYVDGFRHNPQDKKKRLQKLVEVEKRAVEKGQKWAVSSKEALERRVSQQDDGYGKSDENIGNLPLGEIDAVITSPPFGRSNYVKENSQQFWEKAKEMGKRWGSNPPSGTNERQYSDNNIARLEHGQIDTIITSPPYENQLHDSREKREKGCWKGSELDVKKNLPMGYSENEGNIGNLRKETYLEAMFHVYSEMWKVLKPAGLAIIVVKPFIRNKRVVDLPYHTWLLLQKVGFKLEKLYKLRLKQESFWRILYHKKYSNIPRVKHEYIIICNKGKA